MLHINEQEFTSRLNIEISAAIRQTTLEPQFKSSLQDLLYESLFSITYIMNIQKKRKPFDFDGLL